MRGGTVWKLELVLYGRRKWPEVQLTGAGQVLIPEGLEAARDMHCFFASENNDPTSEVHMGDL